MQITVRKIGLNWFSSHEQLNITLFFFTCLFSKCQKDLGSCRKCQFLSEMQKHLFFIPGCISGLKSIVF